jgi:hypothetical protein
VSPAAAFAASSAPGLFWLGEPALPAGYGIALVYADDPSPAPPSVAFAASWTGAAALYVATATKPAPGAEESTFLAGVRGLWPWMGARARFAWIADSRGPSADWAPQWIAVAQAAGATTGVVDAPARLAFGDYAVGVSAGVTLTLQADGFALSGGPTPAFTFTTPDALWVPTAPGGTAFPFAGALAGCLTLDLALTDTEDYDRLDVGLRYAVDPEREEDRHLGLLRTLRYPVFDAVPPGGVTLAGAFDPALPLACARTRLTYAAAAQHDSAFRGPLGHGVRLGAQAGTAALAFHRRPGARHALLSDDPLYLAPTGPFALSLGNAIAPALACGTSGYEVLAVSSTTGATLTFAPGGAAYAAGLVGDGDAELTAVATCPYGAVAPAGAQDAVTYYAQPRDGALHDVRPSGDPDLVPYLEYLPLAAGATGAADPAYPLVPYARAAGDADVRAALEARVLAPRRRRAREDLAAAAADARAQAQDPTPVTAATPRGLLATIGADRRTWQALQLAAPPAGTPAATPPPLQLLTLGRDLKNALLSNELFAVIADPRQLLDNADLEYWVTDGALDDLRALPVAQRPSADVLAALAARARTPQAGRQAFLAYLAGAGLPSTWTQWQAVIVQLCAYFELSVEGWRFRLSPTTWPDPATAEQPLLMIIKMSTGPLRAMATDPGSWTWSQAAQIGGRTDRAAAELQRVIEAADARVAAATSGRPSVLDDFVTRVLDDPSWNGVLVLNAPVPLDALPAELRGLGAGIDAERFRAHHVGVSISPVTVDTVRRTLALKPSPLFGLIDYEDPVEIDHVAGDFAFKVLALRVLFANSQIADFSSRAELFVNRLLGDAVSLQPSDHYNNLVLEGTLQRAQGGAHYVFTTARASRFLTDSKVVDSVEVIVAEFATASAGQTVTSRFSLWGNLRFRRLDAIDLFSFGPWQPDPTQPPLDGRLAYSGFGIDMAFDASDPVGTTTFAPDVAGMAFDATASVARPESWFTRFPLRVAGLAEGAPGDRLADAGFLPVRAPLAQPALDRGWHALTLAVDLGTLGALAADAGLVVTVALAWGPGGDGGPQVNIGLQLPGVRSLGQLLPVQGVLGLGFQSLELRAPPAPSGGPSYVLDLKRFGLHVLGWTLPPGQADLHLFGDPEATTDPTGARRSAVGWYASYQQRR